MDNVEIAGLAGVIFFVCEAVKKAGLKTRYVPLLAVGLGLVGSFALNGEVSWFSTASGVLVALSTQGLYSGVKKTVLNK